MGQDLDGTCSDVYGFCVHALRATAATNALAGVYGDEGL
jgi:hypothetical protein